MDADKREILSKMREACTDCQACAADCEILRELGRLTPRDVAGQVKSGRIDENISRYVISCDLCGLCVQNCPEGLDIPGLVRTARQVMLEKGATDAGIYRAMWVDHDWNAVTLYRDTYEIDYSDLTKPRCDVLFFPGCFLANAGPELVRSAVDWLAENYQQEVGLSLMCCGLPLLQAGLADEAESYLNHFWKTAGDMGTRRIVTSCPSCHYQLLGCQTTKDIEVVSIYKLMDEAGVLAPNPGTGRLTVHDSCPDRDGELGSWVRRILGNYEIVEMAHHGAGTVCCGAGGLVSMVDWERYDRRVMRRLNEFWDTGADICVTYCMTCGDTLSRAAAAGKVRHILELVFNRMVDYRQYAYRTETMWQGEPGERNLQRLENSRPMEPLADDVGVRPAPRCDRSGET